MNVSRTDFDDTQLCDWWEEAYAGNRLLRNTFFQSPAWNRAWYAHYVSGHARRDLLLLKCTRGEDIVAVAPLYLQQRRTAGLTAWAHVQFLADRLAQYTDLVTTERDPEPVWHALLAYLRSAFPAAWLQLHDVLAESTVRRAGLAADERTGGEPYLRIPLGKWNDDALLARCTPHMRREIHRARRRMHRSTALHWTVERTPAPALVDLLIERNRERFGDASWFADETARRFFHDVCAAGGREVLFSVLRDGQRVIHIMCSYLHGDEMLYVLSGMDERARSLSPGTMNLDLTIRHAALSGCAHFDFLRGDEGYKREFAPEERRSEHWVLHPGRSALRYRMLQSLRRVGRRRGVEGGMV